MIARFHEISVDPDQIAHEFGEHGKTLSGSQIQIAARKLGLSTRLVRPRLERLPSTSLPALAFALDGSSFVLARCDGTQGEMRALVHDPLAARPEVLTGDQLLARWSGDLILFQSKASIAGELAKFDFSWFVPAVVKYRRLLLEVLAVSFVLQMFALITPLFFQVIMDKVLVHRGFSTLDVIAVGLLAVVTFEVVLGTLRSYVFAHTSSRIDVELGARACPSFCV